jgi:transposase-like protein
MKGFVMAAERKHFTGTQKVQIIREHLLDAVPISQVCEKHGITPTQFYQWQKTLFENAAAAFEPPKRSRTWELENQLKQLGKKLAKKDEVIAEIMASHVELKKSLGGD